MKKYDNELELVKTLLSNRTSIINAQSYIKEHYNISSLFDKNLSLLYIWDETNSNKNICEAKTYIKEHFSDELLEIDTDKPQTINEYSEEIIVVYFEDGTMYNMYYTDKEADEAIKKLKEESPANKPYKKKEQVSNYVK